MIRERTNGGADLLEFLLSVAEGAHKAGVKLRVDATNLLLAYAFGKPSQSVEVSGSIADTSAIEGIGLSVDEIRRVVQLSRERKAAAEATAEAETVAAASK